MRIVFLGSAELSRASLRALVEMPGVELCAAVTQPDRPAGRNRRMTSCPLKSLALELDIPVLAPDKINSDDNTSMIADFCPDLCVVVAYGQILGRRIIDLPRLGCVNVHTSLLPAYRGAAPIQWAVANGEKVTGVTTMYIAEKMDAGDIIMQRETQIGADETAGDLHDRLAVMGAELLVETVGLINDGKAERIAQDDAFATYAPKLSKRDGRINWTNPAKAIYNHIRGFNPWPVCWTEKVSSIKCQETREGTHLRIWRARIEDGTGEPGSVIEVSEDGPLVAAGEGALRLVEVQPEGGRIMTGVEYLHGHDVSAGDIFGRSEQ